MGIRKRMIAEFLGPHYGPRMRARFHHVARLSPEDAPTEKNDPQEDEKPAGDAIPEDRRRA
jgi:hypothetical protein